ncbi:MAG: LCP family protein [Oribacterium sp.]|nr:LCP family protein [Oribacterium sp.]
MNNQDFEHQNHQDGLEVPNIAPRREGSVRPPRRTAPSRAAQQRMEELRYRTSRVEASFEEDEDSAYADAAASSMSGAGQTHRTDGAYDRTAEQTNAQGRRMDDAMVAGAQSRRNGHPRMSDEMSANAPRQRVGNTRMDHATTAQGLSANGGSGAGNTPRRARGRKRANWGRRVMAGILVLVVIIGGFFGCSAVKSLGQPTYWTVAVFGVDSRDGNLGAGALSDVIMLASINRKTGDVNLTSVYRDTYLQIDDEGKYHKLNEAYFKGGPKQAIAALNRNFDLDVDDYVTFNWKAVAEGLNVLGGVDLDISDKEFAYINAFITETVQGTGLGSVQLEHSGMNHLDGVQAVAYARLRLMDTDFNRTARQRKVLELAMQKAKAASKKTLVATAMEVMPDIQTSIGADDILDIAKTVKKYNIQNAVGFPFSRDTTNVGKMNVVVPATLVSNVAQLHPFLYGDDAAGYTPSAKVQEISAHIQKKTGIGELPNADIPKIGGGTGVTKAPEGAANSGDSGKFGNSGQNPAAAVETPAPETTAAAESESALESTEAADSTTKEEESTIEELSKGEESKKDEHSDKTETSDKNENQDKNAPSGKTDSADQNDSSDRHNGGTSVKETENAGPEVGPVVPPQTTEAGPIAETAA